VNSFLKFSGATDMLRTRILTALLLLPLLLVALFTFSPAVWAVFSALVAGIALWEYARMAKMTLAGQGLYLGCSAALALLAWLERVHLPLWAHALSLLFWLGLVPLWLARRWTIRPGLIAWLLGWLLMLPAWFAMLDWRSSPERHQVLRLLAILALVWVADIAAYFSGKAFGRHKLAPSISPGKSWEGVLGALLAVQLYTWAVWSQGWLQHPVPLPLLLLLALPLTMVSVAGDLLESWFKRCAAMKDSSCLLPGHGGVYDRIDSLIAVLAVSNALKVLCGW
jgi:phosphatidate cytidylyltransferase